MRGFENQFLYTPVQYFSYIELVSDGQAISWIHPNSPNCLPDFPNTPSTLPFRESLYILPG